MTREEVYERMLYMTTDQLTEAVESVDPDWLAHFGDLDRAASRYLEYGQPEFWQAVERITEEAA